MCPETNEHRKIKEIVLGKLKDMYGTGLKEYPNSGQINDVYAITTDKIEIFVENIWTSTKSNFQRDLNILHRSSANVKILIVNPEILRDNSLKREFEKTRIAERKNGISVSDMIDGSKILTNPKFADAEFIEIVESLVKEVRMKREGEMGMTKKKPKPTRTATFTHTYYRPGRYSPKITVRDAHGQIAQASTEITVIPRNKKEIKRENSMLRARISVTSDVKTIEALLRRSEGLAEIAPDYLKDFAVKEYRKTVDKAVKCIDTLKLASRT